MSNPYHDDQRLTAYVLGELSPAETAEVESLLADSAEARAAMEEIRGMTDQLSEQLRAEPMPALTPVQRNAVMSGPSPNKPRRNRSPQPAKSGNGIVVAAACLMVLAAGWLMAVHNSTKNRTESTSTSLDGEILEGQVSATTPKDDVDWLSVRGGLTIGAPRDPRPGNNRTSTGPTSTATNGGSKGGQNGQLAQNPGNTTTLSTIVRLKGPSPQNPISLGVTPRFNRGFGYSGRTSGFAVDGRSRGGWGLQRGRTSRLFGGKKSGGQGQSYFYDGRSYYSRQLGRDDSLALRPGTYGAAGWAGYDMNGVRIATPSLVTGGSLSKGLNDSGKATGKPVTSHPDVVSADHKQAKPTKKKPKAKKPAIQWFAAKDVKTVREQVVKQFDDLAKRHPKRELAILRVKTRISGRLAGIERQVALAVRAGRRIPAVEGRVVVATAIRDEVKTLDVDGDGRADFGNEQYDTIVENTFLTPLANPLSTFSIDVDTASYSNVRRFIEGEHLPPRNAVRVEELVNYFRYDYPQPKSKTQPFSVTLESGPCPWNVKHRLVLIGLKGREMPHDKRPAVNLVFLIDVSGSMSSGKKLPLVKLGLEMLVDQMQPKDSISIVTYSDSARVVLEPTRGDKKTKLLTAIHSLHAAGSTNGSAGIQTAYAQAQKAFLKTGANRVILCTDGDFNVGIKSDDKLVELIRKEAKAKVFLSVFGYGIGNTKHAKLEKIADKGNGHYAYIDKFAEAKKVFIEEMSGTLFTIAKDVKIQVEFNPAQVASYRLIGYENRLMAAQDFNNDKKDAGEIGAGHTVTALYEIVPAVLKGKKPSVDKLKYQRRVVADKAKPETQELMTVKLRYKQPKGDKSTKIEFSLKDDRAKKKTPSENFDFASAVAMFGLHLRDSKYAGNANLDLVRELAAGSMSKDPEGHRSEFVKLVQKTQTFVARKLGKAVPAPRPIQPGKQ